MFEAAGGRFVRVDHIGSTAVPGLASKDVLDLQVTVDNFDGTDALVEPLRPLGFEFRAAVVTDHVPAGLLPGPGWAKRYFARRIGLRAHLHVRATGQPNQRYALLFRDYLRCSPQAAAAYAAFKRHLAATELDYVDAKDSFCDMVMVAAEAWGGASRLEAPSARRPRSAGRVTRRCSRRPVARSWSLDRNFVQSAHSPAGDFSVYIDFLRMPCATS